jgi:septum formation protein
MIDGREPETRPPTALRSVALASISPRRRQLLASLGLEVVQVASTYREDDHLDAHTDPRDLVLAHAQGKARLAEAVGPPVLVAADTEVVIDGEVLGKPRDAAEAAAMLARLSGRTHTVHTGFTVVDRATGKTIGGVESTRVTFATLTGPQIERYVATGEPLDKAGAYGIQGRGALLVASIDGDFYTVMGLPLARLGRAFASLGYEVL